MPSSSAWWVDAAKTECRAFANIRISFNIEIKIAAAKDFSLAVGALATTPLHPSCRHQSGQYILNAVICQLKALKAKGVAGLPDPLAQIMVKD
jgi:hypothetical protein